MEQQQASIKLNAANVARILSTTRRHHHSQSYKGDGKQQNQSSYEQMITDRLNNVNNIYEKIHDNIARLDDKVDALVSHHDNEMLRIYQQQMSNLNKEIKEWKEKASERYTSAIQSDKITSLSESLTWFKEECLSLLSELNEKGKVLSQLQHKVSYLNQENDFLRNQLKILQKREFSPVLDFITQKLTRTSSQTHDLKILAELRTLFQDYTRMSTIASVKTTNGKDSASVIEILPDFCVQPLVHEKFEILLGHVKNPAPIPDLSYVTPARLSSSFQPDALEATKYKVSDSAKFVPTSKIPRIFLRGQLRSLDYMAPKRSQRKSKENSLTKRSSNLLSEIFHSSQQYNSFQK